MATDPTRNEADGASEDSLGEPAVARTPGPPRPPRPGKRSKESGRISIPLPQSRRELEPVDVGGPDQMDAAPSIDISAAERGEPAHFRIGVHAKPPSAPAESFADIDADFADVADHAPNAPVTPLHGLSAREIEPAEITPARGTPMHFVREEPIGASKRFGHGAPFRGGPVRFGRDDESDSEPEPTIVGKVPDSLLELSGANEENTQAFTAPRELIELARRSREDRARGNEAISADEHETPRPTWAANSDAPVVTPSAVPLGSLASQLSAEAESDAAPPVKRTASGEMEAAALPSRGAFESALMAPSGPEIDIEPPSELLPSAPRAVELASRSVSGVHSELPSALRRPASRRGWLMTIAVLLIAGVVIARWRDIALLFH